MDPLGKKELLSFYDRHLRDFGDSPQAVRWTPEGQLLRYRTIARIAGDLSGKSILDFGCGKGDFYGFMREQGMVCRYCGLDVNENLIKMAKTKYPEAEFVAADIDDVDFDREFDVVIACGVFNLRIAGIEESMKVILKRLFRIAREVLHVNFLTCHVPRRSVELFYVNPGDILDFTINGISQTVILHHMKEDIYLSVYK
jgi:SAM-dependent methyltransferase